MRILIIEDNILIARSLQRGLRPVYAVDSCLTGKDGLAQAESADYDLIMLDLELPDMHGLQVCQQLRSHGLTTPSLLSPVPPS